MRPQNLESGLSLDLAHTIADTVSDPLLILNADLGVERSNGAFLLHFQLAPQECIGRALHELGRGEWNIPALRNALREVLSTGASLAGFQVQFESASLGQRSLLINARRFRHQGPHESIVVAIEDRTEIDSAQSQSQEILRLEQEVRRGRGEADRIKDEFVATLSHELRGPLSSLVGWVHVLSERGLDETTRERGQAAIARGVHAQARLIEELLDYSRSVTGKLSLSQRLMDLVPVAQAAVEAIRFAADAKQISVELVRGPGPAMVLGDPDRLQQVLWNLLSNAVKFTPRDGRVTVWIGRVGTSLLVRVSDTGSGIPADVLPHVFERFRPLEDGRSQPRGGLGLGLSLAKQLVEIHGGTVEAQSPGAGRGTTLTMALPIPPLRSEPTSVGEAAARSNPTDAPTAPSATERLTLVGLRVLVVEDDPDGRELLVVAFEHSGAQVRATASAPEALEAFRRDVPDVLISDIGLPGEDGYALMGRIRALPATEGGQVPALALTAYSGAEDRRKALAAGFQMHVPKPAEPAALVAKVAMLAARSAGGRMTP